MASITTMRSTALACGLASALLGSSAGGQTPAPKASLTYMEAARRLGGNDFPGAMTVCGGNLDRDRPSDAPQPPAKIFDDLYYFGDAFVGAWALTTDEGIILFDAGANSDQAERYIVGGMKTVGLDPAKIRYIVIMHGHIDHYGGARLLQERYGARLMVSRPDWDYMDRLRNRLDIINPDLVSGTPEARMSSKLAEPLREPATGQFAAPRIRDLEIRDGDRLTLGGKTVILRLTPGHSEGTVSALIPVRDGGEAHVAANWGGTAPITRGDLPEKMLASVAMFKAAGDEAGADVVINSHLFMAGPPEKLKAALARKPGDPNPYVVGKSGFDRFMDMQDQCIRAVKARKAEL